MPFVRERVREGVGILYRSHDRLVLLGRLSHLSATLADGVQIQSRNGVGDRSFNSFAFRPSTLSLSLFQDSLDPD